MSQHTDPDPHAPSAAHAEYDGEISRRPVYWTGAILMAMALIAFASVWAFMRGMEKYDAAHAPKTPALQEEIEKLRAQGPPGPRLQPDPNRDMREMRAEEDRILSSYDWADKASGTVRIPITEAMDLVAAKGLGAKPAVAAPTADAPAAGAHP